MGMAGHAACWSRTARRRTLRAVVAVEGRKGSLEELGMGWPGDVVWHGMS